MESGPPWYRFERFKEALLHWMVYCHIAIFQLINGTKFRVLLEALNSDIAAQLPGRNTIRKWVLDLYQKEKQRLRKDLWQAKSMLHISFDLWSSPNNLALIAIIVHYIDTQGNAKQRLLAVKEVEGEHSGLNIAGVLLEVFKDYQIGRQIGYFVVDNAQNNDTAIEEVLRALFPHMSAKKRKQRRLRCLGHVINLAAQRFILGHRAKKDLRELAAAQILGKQDEVNKFWEKQGAIGLLHQLVKYIRLTPQRRQEFAKCKSEEEGFETYNNLWVSEPKSLR